MRKKWLLIPLGLTAGATLICAILLGQSEPVRFSPYMVEQIKKGMTEAEVLAITKKPPGDYACPETCFADVCPDWKSDVWSHPEGRPRSDGTTEKAWICDGGGVAVVFNPDGRVARAYWEPMFVPAPRSPFDALLRVLRQLIR
jgi:hypothetical protein